jgi:hypothetical protein
MSSPHKTPDIGLLLDMLRIPQLSLDTLTDVDRVLAPALGRKRIVFTAQIDPAKYNLGQFTRLERMEDTRPTYLDLSGDKS